MSAATPSSTQPYSMLDKKAKRKVKQEILQRHERAEQYISKLEGLLQEKGIEIPSEFLELKQAVANKEDPLEKFMKNGSLEALAKSAERIMKHTHRYETLVQYRNLTFWNNMAERKIPTMISSFLNMVPGFNMKRRVNVLNDLSGRILPKRMTLVMGPPGCGKTTFLKALSGQLTVGSAHLEGEILYNGDPIDSGKYLIGKLATYSDEKELHSPILTVRETLEFAWKMTSGGHHSYNIAKDEESAMVLDEDDEHLVKIDNVLKVLGLVECADVLVGDGAIRGVSGGQKRRVTLGETLLPPRSIRFLDAISNGLDSATTFDIVQSIKFMGQTFGYTTVISLLQPAPEVFYSFEDVIVLADGQIIYHGSTTSVIEYFSNLGYHCPDIMDVADFLQEVPTADGKRFVAGHKTVNGEAPPLGTEALVQAWKSSALFQKMMDEMDVQVKESTGKWPAVFNERYAGSFWFALTHCLERDMKLVMRNTPFLIGRAVQSLLMGGIAGSLFNSLDTEDSNSMSGILFLAVRFGSLAGLSTLPIIFEQRAVFYKHSRNLYYPTSAYILSQALSMYPVIITENLVFSLVVYWSVGMSDDDNGSRFFTFVLIMLTYSLAIAEVYRWFAFMITAPVLAMPVGGGAMVLMMLFSGFIIPKINIPPGWIWFYWLNPIAHAYRSITVNEFLAPDYDFPACAATDITGTCIRFETFGHLTLSSKGNPTEQVWVWYGFIILLGMYVFFFMINALTLSNVRLEAVPPPPIVVDYSGDDETAATGTPTVEIPFEPASFAFKNIWYTVTLPTGEDLDLLKGVSGYFEPGTVTALMGSSGAGKTTLLDVLSGRKNTGVIKGNMFVNGKRKDDKTFKRAMGYVEQFDTLAPTDTAREAIEFSAALRLPGDTPADIRANWVTSVLNMLELMPLEHMMIGNPQGGGMSFEQKKRVSIGVELAANPAILFLDEPTTGLDSRSAQIVIRSIRRVAASGRSIVCTIHQPSAVIFDSFDSLLLLRRGGQTVFFGKLGESSVNLVSYFESIDGVAPKPKATNPASWMLDVIGAGTSGIASTTDFHAHYLQTDLCFENTSYVDIMCPGSEMIKETDLAAVSLEGGHSSIVQGPITYNATYWVQFKVLMYRFVLTYWRSPVYNLQRLFQAVVVALIFSSTYANQQYTTDVDVISRIALIYITTFHFGFVGMVGIQPVMFGQRSAFYREQQSEVYDVGLYTLAGTIVEIPYLLLSSVCFLIPYFWIVGFDQGDVAVKFFWYWLFMGLYCAALVFLGNFLACFFPNSAASNVVGGIVMTLFSTFCGFMIKFQNFPDFWVFMYYVNPMTYTFEGLVTTQFNRDHTMITVTGTTEVMTAQTYVHEFYSDWRYSSRGYDIMALVLFIILFRVMAYLALKYVRHDKR